MTELWKILGGELRNHVTLNNLRMFLLAIMGTYVEQSLKKEEHNLHTIGENPIGSFNEHGDIFLEPYEIPRIQKVF
jgi:hypothetical protein